MALNFPTVGLPIIQGNRLHFLFILLCLAFELTAQDSIVKLNGDIISAKVLEVKPDQVIYRKISNLDGPLYTILKDELKEIVFENGDKELFNNHIVNEPNVAKTNQAEVTRRPVFIRTTADSDVHPTQEVWKEEIEKYAQIEVVKSIEEANLILEFKINRAMGEARVSVIVQSPIDNKTLWESERYRGTSNIQNRMGASLHGIRKCLAKGLIPAIQDGKF